ncbi:hypothetical protein GT755_04170 [Herbidospora sp. NEAU-GS84]|uniref:Uncharacterized protein n=1 Tax=Herbidospora solisilvae TaxID=2696284 RepID=A0A7C9J183_9ACTN|nr:hypothetical protein [Herbidospora solisilvae]NAS20880.1 hypothetical protein [Herbidospora solisilvae]
MRRHHPKPSLRQRLLRKPALVVGGALLTVLTGTIAAVTSDAAKLVVLASPSPTPIARPVVVAALKVRDLDPGDTFVFPAAYRPDAATLRKINELRDSPDMDELAVLMRSLGGVDVHTLGTRFVLENVSKLDVRILDLRVSADCRAPLGGTVFYSPPQGGELLVDLSFDLDARHPIPRFMEKYGWSEKSWFDTQTVLLAPGEQQVFDVQVETGRYCEYRLVADVLQRQKTVTLTIDDDGAPFRVTGMPPLREAPALYAASIFNPDTCDDFAPVDPPTYDEVNLRC